MHIQGPIHVHGAQPINAPHRANAMPSSPRAASTQGADQLDISPQADFLSRIRDVPDIRADRVAQIRAAIESGTYETSEKLEGAVERLLDELA